MKKIYDVIQKIIHSKFIGYVIILIVASIVVAPLFSMDLTQNNEAKIHMTRILSIDSVIKDGIFPPIIDYSQMNGFGYALNLFYGPITTYIPIILYNIFETSGLAFKIFTFLAVLISGFTMYKFIYTVTKRKSMATIGAIIYISAPYKLSNLYFRNAVGEYTAFIFIPLVFEGLYNIIDNNIRKSYLLSVGIIGLILSHTISTVYTAIFAFLYLLLNIEKLKNLKIWKSIIINILIALLVCMFFIVPLFEYMSLGEYSIYDKSIMHTSCEEVFTTTLGLRDLFASEFGNQEIRFSIGIMIFVLTFLGIFTYKKIKTKYKNIYFCFGFIAFIALIMSSKLFPWFIMPSFMGVIQFAWRNLGFFAFFIALFCAINTVTFAEEILKKEWIKDTFLFAVIISICVFSALGVMRDWKFGDLNNEKVFDKYLSENERIYPYSINREYLPVKALDNIDYMIERENKSYVIDGSANITSEEKNKLQDVLYLENVTDGTIIELPYIYYLGYEVDVIYNNVDLENKNTTSNRAETTKKQDTFESDNGFLSIKLDSCDSAKIIVQYKGTTLEKISYIISAVGIIILILFIYKERRKDLLHGNRE